MKEHPILFSTPMVHAILEGRKTQTRRVVKPQPPSEATSAGVMSAPGRDHDGEWSWLSGDPKDCDSWGFVGDEFRCPYGQPGDRLWVRETHAPQADCWGAWERALRGERIRQDELTIHYAADYSHDERPFIEKWRPSIHMPRWASRITLEITGVRVDRLRDISEDDAIAEGIERDTGMWRHYGCPTQAWIHSRDSYRSLWESINGPGSWEANPWVWVVEFKRI